jgi:hypothetical protein
MADTLWVIEIWDYKAAGDPGSSYGTTMRRDSISWNPSSNPVALDPATYSPESHDPPHRSWFALARSDYNTATGEYTWWYSKSLDVDSNGALTAADMSTIPPPPPPNSYSLLAVQEFEAQGGTIQTSAVPVLGWHGEPGWYPAFGSTDLGLTPASDHLAWAGAGIGSGPYGMYMEASEIEALTGALNRGDMNPLPDPGFHVGPGGADDDGNGS